VVVVAAGSVVVTAGIVVVVTGVLVVFGPTDAIARSAVTPRSLRKARWRPDWVNTPLTRLWYPPVTLITGVRTPESVEESALPRRGSLRMAFSVAARISVEPDSGEGRVTGVVMLMIPSRSFTVTEAPTIVELPENDVPPALPVAQDVTDEKLRLIDATRLERELPTTGRVRKLIEPPTVLPLVVHGVVTLPPLMTSPLDRTLAQE
jgi:hypothetical protein